LLDALGLSDAEVYLARDYIVVFETEAQLNSLRPNMDLIKQLDALGVVVTAPGISVDFVSRAFFPKIGIEEDPVTGSTHCALAPYWSARLGKMKLAARQLSERGGELYCVVQVDSVLLSGHAKLLARGEVFL
jgi:predicted PhzF superfamily epimerase YddE/YHI9